NDAGQIAGTSTFDGGEVMHAVLWEGGAPLHLGALGDKTSQAGRQSFVLGINQAGEMVGFGDADDQGHSHAVYWGRDRQIVDLGTLPGDTESSASAINGAGMVVGWSGSSDASQPSRPVVWINRTIRPLALQPGQAGGAAHG